MRSTLPPPNPQVNDPVALRQISQGVRQALVGNIIFQNNLHVVVKSITSTDSPYSMVAESVLLANATGGNITINLPAASIASGFVFFIKKTDAGINTVTIDGSGAETIDGAATKVLITAYQATTLVCDGSQWFTI